MSFLSGIAWSTGSAVLPLDLPMIPQFCGVRGDAERSLREDNWENEGGHLAGVKSPAATLALSANDVETLEAQVRRTESKLAGDFSDGRVGMRYNTYEHRSCVLRQQKAKLDVLWAGLQSQEATRMNDPSELDGAAAAEQMARYEITRVPVDQYRYKDYRY